MADYRAVFNHPAIMIGYANSAFYAFFGTVINVIVTILAAYPLSRKDFFRRKLIALALVFTRNRSIICSISGVSLALTRNTHVTQ